MSRKIVFLLPCVALIAAGCNPLAGDETRPMIRGPVGPSPAPVVERAPQAAAVTSTPPSVATSTAAVVQFEQKTLKEDGKNLTLDISYPQMVNAADTEMQKAFNQIVFEKNIRDQVAQMRTDVANTVKEGMMTSAPWFLDMSGDAPYQSPRLVSVFLAGSQYTGGAHPNAIYDNVLFDTQLKREVSVGELFVDASSTLKQLSDWSLAEIKKNTNIADYSDPDWMASGVAPDERNFQFAHFGKDGLTVTFPPYQVAAYVAGPQEVVFAWDKINPLLKPEYRSQK